MNKLYLTVLMFGMFPFVLKISTLIFQKVLGRWDRCVSFILTNFYETWYEHHVTGCQPSFHFLNFCTNMAAEIGCNWTGLASLCKQRNEPSGSIIGGEFLE
jgi:hypothetical protein